MSDKKQWTGAKEAYEKNDNVLFAIPLHVENVPGIMLEFLETLQPKKEAGTKMSFILQGALAKPVSFGAERHTWKCYRHILTVSIMER